MKVVLRLLVGVLAGVLLVGCGDAGDDGEDVPQPPVNPPPEGTPFELPTLLPEATFTPVLLGDAPVDEAPVDAAGADEVWQPGPGTSWQWQLLGEVNTSYDVEMYDVDLFDVPWEVLDVLKADERVVICYFSAGSWENWRGDAERFPEEVLGNTLEGWEDEKWLDVRQIELLEPVMLARLDYAVQRGCDGVEPDNMDAYANDSGFSLSYEDQLAYNIWIAEQAHLRGLSVGLKNDLGQIEDLVAYYDWALNEECFQYDECDPLLLFIEADKAVFGVEYVGDPAAYCPQAVELGFSWLSKSLDLGDEPPGACE